MNCSRTYGPRWRPHVSGTSLSVQKFRFRLVKIGACPFSKNRAGHLQPKKNQWEIQDIPLHRPYIGLIYGTSNQLVPGQHGHWKICSSQPSPVPKLLLTGLTRCYRSSSFATSCPALGDDRVEKSFRGTTSDRLSEGMSEASWVCPKLGSPRNPQIWCSWMIFIFVLKVYSNCHVGDTPFQPHPYGVFPVVGFVDLRVKHFRSPRLLGRFLKTLNMIHQSALSIRV